MTMFERLALFSLASTMQTFQWCAAAEHVVVETNSPMYTAGQELPDRAAISLAANEYLIALSDEALTTRIDGPYEGPIESVPPSEIDIGNALAQIFGGPQSAQGALGGIRGPGADEDAAAAKDTRPSAWLVHAGLTGDQCILAGKPVQLWRENGTATITTQITAVASGRSARVEWPSANQRVRWPSALTPENEAVYLIRPLDAFRSTAVRLHSLNPALADTGLATVAWMAAKGCIPQARLLLASL